jgi:hypothetical protein
MAETDEITTPVLIAITAFPGCMAWRQNTGTYRTMDGKRVVKVSANGVADIMGVYWGKAIAVETKTANGTLRVSQKRFRNAFEAAGGVYIVARSPEEAIAKLGLIR